MATIPAPQAMPYFPLIAASSASEMRPARITDVCTMPAPIVKAVQTSAPKTPFTHHFFSTVPSISRSRTPEAYDGHPRRATLKDRPGSPAEEKEKVWSFSRSRCWPGIRMSGS